MARSFEITVQGKQYTGQTASAVAQEEMLGLVCQAGIIAMLKDDVKITDAAKVQFLATVPKAIRDRLRDLVTKSDKGNFLLKTEDGVPVAANLFQDSIQAWFLLLADVLRENLNGFFTLNGLDENVPVDADQIDH